MWLIFNVDFNNWLLSTEAATQGNSPAKHLKVFQHTSKLANSSGNMYFKITVFVKQLYIL